MVVLLPKGIYRVTQALTITQSNVVLRGAGVRWGGGLGCPPRGLWWAAAWAAFIACLSPGPSPPCRLLRTSCNRHVLQVLDTKLWFPKGLKAIYGNKYTWATGGAFLT